MLLNSLLVIGMAAAVTYLLRSGGLLLAEALPRRGRVKQFMDALPGTILVALVAPGVYQAGLPGQIAALATALCAWRSGNVLLAMVVGMAVVAGGRYLY
ncbi:MAG: AzlD domain-containing protein [Desulfosarcinaceae bacterium]|nr:AzlD domain-containing protein [Desulfosarcinaceae bacterium]